MINYLWNTVNVVHKWPNTVSDLGLIAIKSYPTKNEFSGLIWCKNLTSPVSNVNLEYYLNFPLNYVIFELKRFVSMSSE